MHFYLLYIDPGSGSILLQAIIAGAAGVVWRLLHFFRRRGDTPADDPPGRNAAGSSSRGGQ